MKYSNSKNSWKKKLIAAFTIGFVAFGMVQPVTAKAEERAEYTDKKYTAKNPNNMLGVAADFGVFAKGTFTATGHNDTNVACGSLNLGNNNGITPVDNDAICYADQIISRAKIDKGYIYFKSGKVRRHPNNHYWYVDGHEVGGDGIKQVYKTPNFMNMEDEFQKLISLSDKLSGLSNQNVTYNADSDKIICNGDFNVLNINAEDLSQRENDLFINNIRGNKVLIVNVDMKDAGSDFKIKRKICFENDSNAPDYAYRPNGNNAKKFDQDAANIIWNFNNYSNNIETLKATAGIILAPKADVFINSGVHLGSVIANNVKNNNEIHYVPFNHSALAQVSVTSINGNCCEDQSKVSRSLPGTEFQLYTYNGSAWVPVEGSLKKTEAISNDSNIATWTLGQPGSYYIQEVTPVAGYVKTPIKAKFEVVEKNGVLKVIKKLGNEAYGYCKAYDNALNAFKIRHYSNEVVAVAFDSKTYEQLNGTTFFVTDENGTRIDGVTDADGVFVVNIPNTGRYTMIQETTKNGYSYTKNAVPFAVYYTPVGQQLVVELDTKTGLGVLEILQGCYGQPSQMDKLTKDFNKKLRTYSTEDGKRADEYEAATDTCITFLNDISK